MKETFKNKENIIRKLAKDYQRSKIIELKGANILNKDNIGEKIVGYMDTREKYHYYDSLQTKIDYILERMEWEYSNFLKREFFNCVTRSDWWLCYYSRSTYYRKKNKAMNVFLGLVYA